MDSTKQYLPYEIAVSENKGKLYGYSRIVFFEEGKEEAGFENITLRWEGNKLILEDEGFFEHAFSKKPSKRVKKEMTLSLETTGDEMTLTGKWKTNRTRFYLVATGTALLKRKKDFKETALYQKLDSLKISPKLSFTQPEKIVAVAEPPKKEVKEIVPAATEEKNEATPVPEPDAEVAAMEPVNRLRDLSLLTIPKKRQPSSLKIEQASKQKKSLFALLTRPVVVYKPKEPEVAVAEKKSPPVIEKPAPVVTKAANPVAEPKKEAPVVAAKLPPPPPAVELPSVQKGAAEIDKRVTKSDQSFYFESDSLLLTLYDNGEVDGDTVTVLMNGNVIFSKVGLTEKANSKTIYITPNMDSVNLVMYAESLGEIPPNTGLLIVNDGEKRYDVRFSADLKTNSGIILRRKKKE